MSSACSFIFMQIKVIFITMVSHLDSLWNRGTRELGNGLLPVADAERGKTRASESWYVLVSLLTGWKCSTSFLRKSCCAVDAKPITFRHLNEKQSNPQRVMQWSSLTNNLDWPSVRPFHRVHPDRLFHLYHLFHSIHPFQVAQGGPPQSSRPSRLCHLSLARRLCSYREALVWWVEVQIHYQNYEALKKD